MVKKNRPLPSCSKSPHNRLATVNLTTQCSLRRSATKPNHLGKTAINLAKLAATYLPRQLF